MLLARDGGGGVKRETYVGYFLATLLSDVVLRFDAASAGAGETALYIPGARFLGMAAERLYSTLSQEDAFRFFHSGEVRFGDATFAKEDAQGNMLPTLPTPACFYAQKRDKRAIANLLVSDAADGARPAKTPFVAADGEFVEPCVEATLKTAIDGLTGTAKTSQLFSYRCLKAGQRFVGYVEAEREADADAASRALEGTRRAGRSKSAEFGEIAVERLGGVARAAAPVAPSAPPGKTTFFYCLSDMCLPYPLQDAPAEALLFAGEGAAHAGKKTSFNAALSFVARRRYAPYNGKLRCRMPEILAVKAGSVLAYDGFPETSERVYAVGGHTERGLGRVWRNPSHLLGGENCCAFNAETPFASLRLPGPKKNAAAPPPTELTKWLCETRAGFDAKDRRERFVARAVKKIDEAYVYAEKIHGEVVGPLVTQWRDVMETAGKLAASGKGLLASDLGDRRSAGWAKRCADGGEAFGTLLLSLAKEAEAEGGPAYAARAFVDLADKVALMRQAKERRAAA
jgi:CRISPR-associated protein Csx10